MRSIPCVVTGNRIDVQKRAINLSHAMRANQAPNSECVSPSSYGRIDRHIAPPSRHGAFPEPALRDGGYLALRPPDEQSRKKYRCRASLAQNAHHIIKPHRVGEIVIIPRDKYRTAGTR